MNLRGSHRVLTLAFALVLCSCQRAPSPAEPTLVLNVAPPLPTLGPVATTILRDAAESPITPPTPTIQISTTATPIGGGAGEIAFVSDRDGNDEIYVMAPDGSRLSRFTSNPSRDGDPVWSPDGSSIAFMSDRDGEPAIYVIPAEGASLNRLTPTTMHAWHPTWSPDGRRIAFVCDVDIFPDTCIVSPDGTDLTRVTDFRWQHEGEPAWSPLAPLLAFDCNGGTDDICLMPSSGGQRLFLTSNLARDAEPAWSPDGKWIAFSSNREGKWGIYVMAADGREARRLLFITVGPPKDWRQPLGMPAWSPDGQWIAYVSYEAGNREIYIMKQDGSGKARITSNPAEDWSPAWRP